MKFKILIVVLMMVMLLPSLAGDAVAIEYQQRSHYVDLEPGYVGNETTVINAADESTIQKEEDFVRNDISQTSFGKYYGCYLQSSLYQFSTIGGDFQITMNYTIGADIIMNGVSELWLRVPIIPAQYDWWHVLMTWDQSVSMIETGPPSYITSAPDDNYKFTTPYRISGYTYTTATTPGQFIGNYWSINGSSNHMIKETINGLYLNLKGVFLPDTAFTVSFTGQLMDGQSPMVYVTQELPDDDYTYAVFDVISLNSNVCRFSQYYTIDFQLAPSFAFIFMNGIGDYGMTSYEFDFQSDQSLNIYGENRTYWSDGLATAEFSKLFDGYQNDSYFSFFMPFETVRNNDDPTDVNIDWKVTVRLPLFEDPDFPGVYWWWFDIAGVKVQEITFWVNDTSNYLLFSTPNKIWNGTLAPEWNNKINLWMNLEPVQNCTLKFLAMSTDEYVTRYDKVNYVSNTISSWKPGLPANINEVFNIHHSFAFTSGAWAQVTENEYYTIYDFKWGRGYSTVGNTTIYVFLDDGGQYLYTGSYEELVNRLRAEQASADLTDLDKMLLAIYQSVVNVAGFIYDGITNIIKGIIETGEFIYNLVTSLVKWIISVATDIAGKVSDIVKGLIFGLPIIASLFIVNYVGQALQTGRIPKITSERRLVKKLVRNVKRQINPRIKKFKKARSESIRDNQRIIANRDKWSRDSPSNRTRYNRDYRHDVSKARGDNRRFNRRGGHQ